MANVKETVKTNLVKLRKEHKMTQMELAEKCVKNDWSVRRLEDELRFAAIEKKTKANFSPTKSSKKWVRNSILKVTEDMIHWQVTLMQ